MNKKFGGVLILGLLLLVPITSHALGADPCAKLTSFDPGCITSLQDKGAIITLLMSFLLLLRTIFWIIAVGMLFYAAYLYLFAGGGEKNVETAKKVLRYAITAMVIALVATSIPWLIYNLIS